CSHTECRSPISHFETVFLSGRDGLMSQVERIGRRTADSVRAATVVSTASQAVEELLLNSIDSGATTVEIRLDLPSYRLSVADNGRGIPADRLQALVGTDRATSKASTVDDVNQAKTYGFRGEALHSLGLTSLLEIQSRCSGLGSYAKVVREGELLHFGASDSPSGMGTVVTVRDIFFKWPVRRRAMNQVPKAFRVKEIVGRMALVNCSVAMTVLNTGKPRPLLRVLPCRSVLGSFAGIFSSDKLSAARKLSFDFKQFHITGYLSPPSSSACHWSKEFQVVYINRRWVRRVDFLQKLINSAFAPCLALLSSKGGAALGGQRNRDPNGSSGQKQELFPVFLLNIECPHGEVDLTFEPDKTLVEFADWPGAKNAGIAMLL
ncbi:unnamed protein product, partial [Discosporangium mesarthrocarpum]